MLCNRRASVFEEVARKHKRTKQMRFLVWLKQKAVGEVAAQRLS